MITSLMLKLSETVRQSVLRMKSIHPDTDPQAYEKLFKQVQTAKSPVVVWQVFPENGKRVVNDTTITSFDLDLQVLYLSSVNDFLDPSLPLFFYSEEQNAIFKSSVREVKDDFFSTDFPNEIKLLDMPDFDAIKIKTGVDLVGMWKTRSHYKAGVNSSHWGMKTMAERSPRDQDFLNNEFEHLSLDEEDKLFADKRESPRVRPKTQKLVKVVKKGESEFNFFDLFDLSRGGMSFVTTIPDNYPKGSEIFITGFDAFDLDDPLVGTVMSHRQLDDAEYDVKVGVKFAEGQA